MKWSNAQTYSEGAYRAILHIAILTDRRIARREKTMEISNNQSYYINPNTRQFTSNVKNTAIKDREVFNGSMQNLLNPIEDLVQVLKTPIKLVDSSSLNRLSNSVNIASDMRIAVNDGYILKVKQQGVEVSGGNDPYDTEAYMKAQKMAGSLSTLLRNACGNMHTVAYSQEELVNNFGSSEFFINKAIGWSLRDYSKTNQDWVRNFVETHKDKMDKLSIREASKYL